MEDSQEEDSLAHEQVGWRVWCNNWSRRAGGGQIVYNLLNWDALATPNWEEQYNLLGRRREGGVGMGGALEGEEHGHGGGGIMYVGISIAWWPVL